MFFLLAAGLVGLGSRMMVAQDTAPAATPAPVATAAATRTVEAPVDGLVRRDSYTVALTLPGKRELLVQGFEFEGETVSTDKLHFKQLAPGVVEITSLAYLVGDWRFRVADSANYYGLGERFDTLNHAHTVVMNPRQDNGIAKGTSTYKPVPFYMSTTGYGLWLDTTGGGDV